MTDKTLSLSSIFSELSKLDEDTFPPVDDWNPPLCENVSMKIDRHLWKSMKIDEHIWKPMKIDEHPSTYMSIF